MKNTIKFLILLVITTSFFACDKLTDVNFDTTITERIPVHINQTTGTSTAFNESIILSLDNNDTHDYLNDIKAVEINSLTYKLIQFSGDANGTIDVQFYIDANPLMQNDIIVKQSVDNLTIFEITDVQELNTIASALKNGHQVTARYQGNALCNNGSMDFKVEISMSVAVTANPI